MSSRKTNRAAAAAGAIVVCLGAGTAGVEADIFLTEVEGLETFYGGFIGDFFEETDFDFGLEFTAVEAACLELEGFTDLAGSTLTFEAVLDGATSAPVQIVTGPKEFEVTLPLTVGPSVVDGAGQIGLTLDTFHPNGADLGSLVIRAVLVFDAVLCPADINGDAAVDIQDLIEVVLAWGACGGDCPADVDGNGTVDVFDLSEVLLSWGPCGER